MNTLPGYGDERTWPKYNGHPNDPRREAWEDWIDDQAAAVAEATIAGTSSLSDLVFENDEGALLDCVFDAIRYDGDVKKAFDDLLAGVRSSIEARERNLLCSQREEALRAERAERRADGEGWAA